jgi:hypothetical protein
MNSASLCSLAGRYDNPIPTRFLAPIDCLKIPAQTTVTRNIVQYLNTVIHTIERKPDKNTLMLVCCYSQWQAIRPFIICNCNCNLICKSFRFEIESIEWVNKDGQAFSPLYDLPFSPTPSSLSTHRKIEKERQLADGKGEEGAGKEPNHRTAREAWPSNFETSRAQDKTSPLPW